MGFNKFIFIFTSLIFIVGCNSGSRSAERNPNINKTDNSKRTCVPESELMANNIVGGQIVAPADEDSKLVMLLVSNGQLCTSVAIAKKVILTAAHCIAGNKTNTYISFYSSVSCESGFNKNLYTQGITDTVVNEKYDSSLSPEKMTGDLALVFLENEIPKGYTIFKIADPQKIDQSGSMYLYGYGKTGSNAGGVGMLRKTVLNHNAFEIDTAKSKVQVDQSNGSGICMGDSGGPSFVTDTNGELQILGINSYVTGPEKDICSEASYQTLVFAYKDWIESKIAAHEKTTR